MKPFGSTCIGVALLVASTAPVLAAGRRCGRGLVDAATGAPASDVSPVCRAPISFDRSSVSSPRIEGPIAGEPTLVTTSFDLASVGYEEHEFFLSGTARAFVNTKELTTDGRWSVATGTETPYKTRIVVYRPIDAGRFNGTVVVEWLNVSGLLDTAVDWVALHTELVRSGAAWVGVSAQHLGVEGGLLPQLPGLGGLKAVDPARYSTLSHPGDSFSFDLFSQAGRALRAPNGPSPLGGLRIRKLIAVGESQSASYVTTYVNAIDGVARVYDGYLIHSRGGLSAPLSQAPLELIQTPGRSQIRSDIRVPVIDFETETDVGGLNGVPYQGADSRNFRFWPAAGTAHADTYTVTVGFSDAGNDPSVAEVLSVADPVPGFIECASAINSGPQHWVAKAAFAALERWVGGGPAPSRAPRIEFSGDPPTMSRDEHGNVRGGIRTSYVDAPIAQLSGGGQSGSGLCFLYGTTVLLDDGTLAKLYPTHADYVSAVRRSNDSAVRKGFLLRADADLIDAWAAETDIGQ